MLTILCSGQGRQHAGMFALTGADAAAASLFEHAGRLLGRDPRMLVHEAGHDVLSENRTAQILCTLQAAAAVAMLADSGIHADCVAGYSVGEVAAWHAAGVVAAHDALELVAVRAKVMDAARQSPQGMLSLRGLDQAMVESFCASRPAAIAIVNPARVFVLGGERQALDAIAQEAVANHAERVVPLDVQIASHTYLLKAASDTFRSYLSALSVADDAVGKIRLLSGIDGSVVLSVAEGLEKLALQLSQPIQWASCLEACVEAGASAFLELGPGRALADMAAANYPTIPARSLDDFRSWQGVLDWLGRVMD